MNGKKARAIRKAHNVKHVRLARPSAEQRFAHVPQRTFWNGEKLDIPARKVTVVVAEPPEGTFPNYWAREYVGQRRKAVRVSYNNEVFHLDDEDGHGWYKVTDGRGSPGVGHKDLIIEPDSVKDRE